MKILKPRIWILLGLLIIIAILAGLSLQSSGKSAAKQPQQMVKVERGNVATMVSATGTIQPVNMVEVSSKITAQIKQVNVKENDQVKAGQVLVELEDAGLQAQVIQAQERLNNAALNYERNQRLNAIGAVPDQQLDNARMDYNIAQANYNEVLSKRNETVITSPIDGTVIGKPLPAGQTVSQGTSNPMVILTVADISKMQIEAQVDQTDIGKIAAGQKVTFTVDAYPDRTFSGTVSDVSQKATVVQNVVYYTIMIDVHDAKNYLKPSMTARVSIVVTESNNALSLPLAAVKTDKNGKYVVIKNKSGQTENVPVTTGIIADDRVELLSGLNEGDSVVMSPPKTQGQSAGGQSTGGQSGRQRGGAAGDPINGMMRRL
jgi:HlyD family secretion protein